MGLPTKAGRILREFAADPIGVTKALPSEWRQKHETPAFTESDFDDDWYEHLHSLLGAPCPETQQVHDLLADIAELLTSKGLQTGRHTYGWYSDADMELSSAIWCAARHIRPEVVIETGVAHGISSRVVLEALSRNDRGHLWSIDLPHPLNHELHAETGAAVTDSCRPRWTYLEGESRRRLPPLTAEVGTAQLFIHDSLHTAKNTLFEMEQAASVMPPGGVMLIDDVRGHSGFATFTRRHPEFQTLLCSSADRVAGFGVAVRTTRPSEIPATANP
jgi:hypothetical protein